MSLEEAISYFCEHRDELDDEVDELGNEVFDCWEIDMAIRTLEIFRDTIEERE